MKPTKEKIAVELKMLRKIVENSKCPFEERIAYSMEHAIRWATENTVGWNSPSKDAVRDAEILKSELAGKASDRRDLFAAAALTGLIASNDEGAGDRLDDVPRYAFEIAESMLKV